MVALPYRQRLILPLAPLGAGALALSVALIVALLPAGMLENLVIDSGIAALIPAAEPPLGITARAALVMIGAGGVGLMAWVALFLIIGTRSMSLPGRAITTIDQQDDAPVLRRADAHPDAPARRPLFASRDLGTPFLDVKAPALIEQPPVIAPLVEQDLPADLNQPLAAYDPQAIPEQPIAWFPKPVEALSETRPQVFDAGERFETFELRPVVAKPTPVRPRAEIDPSASIHALLDRLERSVVRREPLVEPALPPVRESLQESLASLRRLAMSAG